MRHRFSVLVVAALLLASCAETTVSGNVSDSNNGAGSRPVTPSLDQIHKPPKKKKVAIVVPPPPLVVAPAPPPAPVIAAPELKEPVSGPQPIRVALLLPLSGPEAELGAALLDAALLALFDVAPERFTLMPRDTGGDAVMAAEAANDVLGEGAELILGPVFSDAVRAVAEPALSRDVNVVAFSTDRSVAGNGTFLMGFMFDQQVDRVIDYAHAQGLERYAVLAPQSAYGEGVIGTMSAAVLSNGGQMIRVERYPTDDELAMETARRLAEYDSRRGALRARRAELKELEEDPAAAAELARLKQAETLGDVSYDAVMIPEGGNRLRAVAPLLPFYDVDTNKVRFLGTGLWDDETIGREPALVGGWFAGPDPQAAATFLHRFENTYGYRPPRIVSMAYDAMALAAVLSLGKSVPDYSAEALSDANGFAGVDGLFRFHNDGIAIRGLAVMEVQPRGFKVLDPAPDSFDTPGDTPVVKPAS